MFLFLIGVELAQRKLANPQAREGVKKKEVKKGEQ
jgi:hypothetical protein